MGWFAEMLPRAFAGGAAALDARAAHYQGRIAERAAQYNAQLAREEGARRASRVRTEGTRELGRQRAQMGRSGLVTSGSRLDLLVANAAEVERAAMEESLAGEQAAALDESRAKVARETARQVRIGAWMRGGADVLTPGRRVPRLFSGSLRA
jgi:hypothetical protein